MNIGFLGSGSFAVSLGLAWQSAGHDITFAGRDAGHARRAAGTIPHARAVPVHEIAARSDVVVVAVAWRGITEILQRSGGPRGALAGKVVIDGTNPVEFATGVHQIESGSAAELVAANATGALIVKALHLFAATTWPYEGPRAARPVVSICGDNEDALDTVRSLVVDLGGDVALIGPLASARQLEEVAGFVMRVVGNGHNPVRAVPDVPPAAEWVTGREHDA